jgi:hypothetical protein
MLTPITIERVAEIIWQQGLDPAEEAIEAAYRKVYRRLDFLESHPTRTSAEQNEVDLLHLTVLGYASYFTRAMKKLREENAEGFASILKAHG